MPGAHVEELGDLPRSVNLLSLLGHELVASPDRAVERWRQNDSIHDRSGGTPSKSKRVGRLRAIVGHGVLDAMHLDLRAQGPHALVGGTTGSGKSEFLQAWVLGMAAEYSPDRVTFLFVDYKGGAAFADCVHLPHTVGTRDRPQHASGAPRAHEPSRGAPPPRTPPVPEEGEGPHRTGASRRPGEPARARHRDRRVRGPRGRGAGVRRRRRRRRPARPVARHPPHHGDAASGGCYPRQPPRQHEPPRGAPDGRRERQRRRRGREGRRRVRPRDAGSRGREDRARDA